MSKLKVYFILENIKLKLKAIWAIVKNDNSVLICLKKNKATQMIINGWSVDKAAIEIAIAQNLLIKHIKDEAEEKAFETNMQKTLKELNIKPAH